MFPEIMVQINFDALPCAEKNLFLCFVFGTRSVRGLPSGQELLDNRRDPFDTFPPLSILARVGALATRKLDTRGVLGRAPTGQRRQTTPPPTPYLLPPITVEF